MKSKDKTKQKKHESTIGKIIYGFLLFMPLLAIGVTCAYAIFNKNAYQSYYGETINEKIVVENTSTALVENKNYFIDAGTTLQGDIDITFEIENASIGNTTYPTANRIQFYRNNGAFAFRYKNNSTTIDWWPISTNSPSFDYLRTVSISINNNDFYSVLKYYDYKELSFVSEVFYYSIDKVQQSPLFNWAEDSAIYTGMTATCNALDISTTFIPLLMTYWLIISVIYFLYDIILIILHVFHRKIHELEESI